MYYDLRYPQKTVSSKPLVTITTGLSNTAVTFTSPLGHMGKKLGH